MPKRNTPSRKSLTSSRAAINQFRAMRFKGTTSEWLPRLNQRYWRPGSRIYATRDGHTFFTQFESTTDDHLQWKVGVYLARAQYDKPAYVGYGDIILEKDQKRVHLEYGQRVTPILKGDNGSISSKGIHIFRAVLDHAIALARKNHLNTIFLTCEHELAPYYGLFGFQKAPGPARKEGLDMQLVL